MVITVWEQQNILPIMALRQFSALMAVMLNILSKIQDRKYIVYNVIKNLNPNLCDKVQASEMEIQDTER